LVFLCNEIELLRQGFNGVKLVGGINAPNLENAADLNAFDSVELAEPGVVIGNQLEDLEEVKKVEHEDGPLLRSVFRERQLQGVSARKLELVEDRGN